MTSGSAPGRWRSPPAPGTPAPCWPPAGCGARGRQPGSAGPARGVRHRQRRGAGRRRPGGARPTRDRDLGRWGPHLRAARQPPAPLLGGRRPRPARVRRHRGRQRRRDRELGRLRAGHGERPSRSRPAPRHLRGADESRRPVLGRGLRRPARVRRRDRPRRRRDPGRRRRRPARRARRRGVGRLAAHLRAPDRLASAVLGPRAPRPPRLRQRRRRRQRRVAGLGGRRRPRRDGRLGGRRWGAHLRGHSRRLHPLLRPQHLRPAGLREPGHGGGRRDPGRGGQRAAHRPRGRDRHRRRPHLRGAAQRLRAVLGVRPAGAARLRQHRGPGRQRARPQPGSGRAGRVGDHPRTHRAGRARGAAS